jgi:hypothetical protein
MMSMFRHLSMVWFTAAAMCLSTVPAIAGTTTLENMQAAYNGESNAHSRYLAFAKQNKQTLKATGRSRACSVQQLAPRRSTPRIMRPSYEGSARFPRRDSKRQT